MQNVEDQQRKEESATSDDTEEGIKEPCNSKYVGKQLSQ